MFLDKTFHNRSQPATTPEPHLALFDQIGRNAPRAVALLIAALQVGCANGGSGPIRIGVAGPFTDPIGRPMQLAAELAAEEINATGGVGGRRLELVLRDDYANPDSAVFVAGELYDAGVSAGGNAPVGQAGFMPTPDDFTVSTCFQRRTVYEHQSSSTPSLR